MAFPILLTKEFIITSFFPSKTGWVIVLNNKFYVKRWESNKFGSCGEFGFWEIEYGRVQQWKNLDYRKFDFLSRIVKMLVSIKYNCLYKKVKKCNNDIDKLVDVYWKLNKKFEIIMEMSGEL